MFINNTFHLQLLIIVFSIQQVKRLYDTFHEPFKRSVPHPSVPVAENPIGNKGGPTSGSERNEEIEEKRETSKEDKKKEEVSVRSALKAAFAKYSGSKRKAVVQDEKEDDVGKVTK